ncbi:hypothetical protein [Erythrobacter neustonensis]|uniref:Efflux transporter periplasmic adaptor subunit n=1 Tax=Erythrobacter neustonensis TaxID=1112 RepID=A0A192CZJ3_9SPHN|nr:hypothetical protein [Erythrobacter neustonensis]ANK11673.1 hypothetical protein A9D12_00470 [Erythrobacter neustonensis]
MSGRTRRLAVIALALALLVGAWLGLRYLDWQVSDAARSEPQRSAQSSHLHNSDPSRLAGTGINC